MLGLVGLKEPEFVDIGGFEALNEKQIVLVGQKPAGVVQGGIVVFMISGKDGIGVGDEDVGTGLVETVSVSSRLVGQYGFAGVFDDGDAEAVAGQERD